MLKKIRLMKSAALILSILVGHSVFALEWSVVGPYVEEPVYSGRLIVDKPMTLGQATVLAFTQAKVPFVGNDAGINEVNGWGNKVDILNRTQLKAFGWCFSIDGIVPDGKLPEEVVVNNSSKLTWFYAFSWYDKEWKEMCVPAYQEPDFN